MIMGLLLTAAVFGLVACGGTAESQDSPPQATVSEQDVGEVTQEQLVGMVQAIDGMNITIITIQAMIVNTPGQHISSPDAQNEPYEPQEIIIQLTEQTAIEVNEVTTTAGGGQMAGLRAGTPDDLTLQAIVMATGEWHGDEFIAKSLIIMPQE